MNENDHDIEMAEEYDFTHAKRGPVIPPTPGKTRITIRLDNDILQWFHARVNTQGGGSYQALINRALRTYIAQESGMTEAQLEALLRRVIREEIQLMPSIHIVRNETTPVTYQVRGLKLIEESGLTAYLAQQGISPEIISEAVDALRTRGAATIADGHVLDLPNRLIKDERPNKLLFKFDDDATTRAEQKMPPNWRED
jgi:uncharacterized protein (DUF4415 family)